MPPPLSSHGGRGCIFLGWVKKGVAFQASQRHASFKGLPKSFEKCSSLECKKLPATACLARGIHYRPAPSSGLKSAWAVGCLCCSQTVIGAPASCCLQQGERAASGHAIDHSGILSHAGGCSNAPGKTSRPGLSVLSHLSPFCNCVRERKGKFTCGRLHQRSRQGKQGAAVCLQPCPINLKSCLSMQGRGRMLACAGMHQQNQAGHGHLSSAGWNLATPSPAVALEPSLTLPSQGPDASPPGSAT